MDLFSKGQSSKINGLDDDMLVLVQDHIKCLTSSIQLSSVFTIDIRDGDIRIVCKRFHLAIMCHYTVSKIFYQKGILTIHWYPVAFPEWIATTSNGYNHLAET